MISQSTIEILHHNRNRPQLIDKLFSYITNMMNTNIAVALYHFNTYFDFITPPDEPKVIIDNYKNYIDPELAENDTSCIYNLDDTIAVLDNLIKDIHYTSAINDPILKSWLNDRGVSDYQILKWKLIDLKCLNSYNMFQQNATGATIHPAIRHWITDGVNDNFIPDGVMTPVFDLDNNVIGCHNRFLSTVPKIKFASSVPNFHLFTNLRKNSKVDIIYIVEGVFDALALDSLNENIGWIAPSTGFWTEEQLINLIYTVQQFKGTLVATMFDNDRVGLKSNILLASTLNKIMIPTIITSFPEEAKDSSEAIHKHKFTLKDIFIISHKDALKKYQTMEYSPIKKFEDYMDNRHASYSINNYRWN